VVRAEYPSITEYLRSSLTLDDLRAIGIISFSQWEFALGALADVALAANALGSDVAVALWADETPLPDTGWETSHLATRLLRTKANDERVHDGLLKAGLTEANFPKPPIRSWKPVGMPALPDPLTRAAIRELKYDGSGMGRSILQVHPDFNTPIRDDYVWPQRWISRAMKSYAWVYDQTTALIKQRNLSTVVVYNGRFTHDQAVAAAAERAGVRVMYYDTGGLETDFELTTQSLHDWADLQVRMRTMFDSWPDDDRDEVASSWFLNRQSHSEPGFDVFVGSQTRGHLEGIPEAEQVVVYFSSSGDEIAELDLDWSEYLFSQEQALADLAAACRAKPGCILVVRTHPHMRLKPADDLSIWNDAVQSAGPDIHLDASSPVDSYELMRAADLVFTYGSTAGVEAAFLGKPVVIMGPSAYDLVECATRITKADEISALLDSPPQHNTSNALLYGLMMQRRGFNFEYLNKNSAGDIDLAGVPIRGTSSKAMKVSHLRKERLFRWLTAK
jgi:hypothetical protein